MENNNENLQNEFNNVKENNKFLKERAANTEIQITYLILSINRNKNCEEQPLSNKLYIYIYI